MLQVAQGEIKRLDLIIGQFLAAIRPTQPQLQRVQVNDLIAESVQFLSPELAQAKDPAAQDEPEILEVQDDPGHADPTTGAPP